MEAERVFYRLARPNEVEACYAMEVEGFASGEAAAYETIKYRFNNARNMFVVGILDNEIFGFVASTRCQAYTKDSMLANETSHDPKGKLLAIHSVVVKQSYRRKGLATNMIKNYLQLIKSETGVEAVVLMCRPKYLNVYVNSGFTCLGTSKIAHGEGEWLECSIKFDEIGKLAKNKYQK